jgi:hypothetical protein
MMNNEAYWRKKYLDLRNQQAPQAKQEQGEPVKVWQEIECPNCGDMARMHTPQQRTWERPWASLTDEDIERGCNSSWVDRQAFESAVWWAEAKLKEKNNGT